jgi:uncharacterized protein (DUF885 family)
MTNSAFFNFLPFSGFADSIKSQIQANLRTSKEMCEKLRRLSAELPNLDQLDECSLDIFVFMFAGQSDTADGSHWVLQSSLLAEIKFLPSIERDFHTGFLEIPTAKTFGEYSECLSKIASRISDDLEEIERGVSASRVNFSFLSLDIVVSDAMALVTRLRLYQALQNVSDQN